MALPASYPEWIAAGALPVEVHSLVPVLIRGIPALFTDIPEGEKLPPRVVEHAVHHDL